MSGSSWLEVSLSESWCRGWGFFMRVSAATALGLRTRGAGLVVWAMLLVLYGGRRGCLWGIRRGRLSGMGLVRVDVGVGELEK